MRLRSRLLSPAALCLSLAALLGPLCATAQETPAAPPAPVFVPARYGVHPFRGYLADRIDASIERRLLTVDLDALLAAYVRRPGVQDWVGEHVGKFLHAGSLAWRYAADPRLRERLDYAAAKLLAAQEPDGYLGAYLPDHRWTSWDVWSHKYNLIGLIAYHEATGDDAALAGARRAADLLTRTFGPGKRDIIASGTHVGMAPTSVLEPMAVLYRLTGEPRYLEFCRYLVDAWDQENGPRLLTSLLTHGSVRRTANNKAYEMLSNLVGLLELYRVTGDPRFLEAPRRAWADIMARRHYPTGTSSFAEHFAEDHVLPVGGGWDGAKYIAGGEGCVTVTWEQLNLGLLELTGEARYADELERITYNALIGAQSPHTGAVCYFSPMNGRKRYGEVNHGILPDISCCASSIPRGIALIPGFTAGMLSGEPALALYVAGEHPLEVRAPDGAPLPVLLRVETRFPDEGLVRLAVAPARPARFGLRLRVPSWAEGFTAEVAGERYPGRRGEWLRIERDWKPGDAVEIRMDLAPRIHAYPDTASGGVYVQRGPQVLALDENVQALQRLPDGWSGAALVRVEGRRAGKPVAYLMTPFADAGQTNADYESVLPAFEAPADTPEGRLANYRLALERFRNAYGGAVELPDVRFFQFGMGARAKLVYRDGRLTDGRTHALVARWDVLAETILPDAYTVVMQTPAGEVRLVEDSLAVWVEQGASRRALDGTRSPLRLPSFEGHPHAAVLRVLHHEVLINIVGGKPVPNYFVYDKPWYRDSAMMAMVLEHTGNTGLLRDWILGLRDVYDRNNAGAAEADNPGQVLYLISLVSDSTHALVPAVRRALRSHEVRGPDGPYLLGSTDFAEHPVYQTRWAKFGLARLGMADPYVVPHGIADNYAPLFWMDGVRLVSPAGEWRAPLDYPYIDWAADHTLGQRLGPISNRDYPLTWERNASQAQYDRLGPLDAAYRDARLSAPHTWHAAEAFLYVYENP